MDALLGLTLTLFVFDDDELLLLSLLADDGEATLVGGSVSWGGDEDDITFRFNCSNFIICNVLVCVF